MTLRENSLYKLIIDNYKQIKKYIEIKPNDTITIIGTKNSAKNLFIYIKDKKFIIDKTYMDVVYGEASSDMNFSIDRETLNRLKDLYKKGFQDKHLTFFISILFLTRNSVNINILKNNWMRIASLENILYISLDTFKMTDNDMNCSKKTNKKIEKIKKEELDETWRFIPREVERIFNVYEHNKEKANFFYYTKSYNKINYSEKERTLLSQCIFEGNLILNNKRYLFFIHEKKVYRLDKITYKLREIDFKSKHNSKYLLDGENNLYLEDETMHLDDDEIFNFFQYNLNNIFITKGKNVMLFPKKVLKIYSDCNLKLNNISIRKINYACNSIKIVDFDNDENICGVIYQSKLYLLKNNSKYINQWNNKKIIKYFLNSLHEIKHEHKLNVLNIKL